MKRLRGPEHPETLLSIQILLASYYGQGKCKEGEELGLRVIKSSILVWGIEHSYTVWGMACLSVIYMKQQNWSKAEDLVTFLVRTSVRLQRFEPITVSIMTLLSLAYGCQDKWDKAIYTALQAWLLGERIM